MKTRRLAGLVSIAVLAVLVMTACGADDSPIARPTPADSTGEKAVVAVTAKDISLAPGKVRTTAGDVHITYRNEGSIVHTLVIEGVDGFKLDVTRRGDVDEGSVTLAPGTYTMYCDVAGHREAGMHGSLEVE